MLILENEVSVMLLQGGKIPSLILPYAPAALRPETRPKLYPAANIDCDIVVPQGEKKGLWWKWWWSIKCSGSHDLRSYNNNLQTGK